MKTYISLFIFCSALYSSAQKNLFVNFNPVFNGVDLQMNTIYTAADGKALKLDHFDYYVSNIL